MHHSNDDILDKDVTSSLPTLSNQTADEIECLVSTGCKISPLPTEQVFPEVFYYNDLSQIDGVRYFAIGFYVLIIIAAIFGNGLVLLTVIRQKRLRNSVNFLTCNLAGTY